MTGASETPVVTVVLNTYNRADRLPQAVRTVLTQAWPVRWSPFELVVVDDGSTDDTPEAIRHVHDQRLRFIRRANGGLSAARNTGLEAARGEYVVFLDDDDDPDAEWLVRLSTLIRDNRGGIASCGARIVGADGTVEIREPRDLGAPFDHVVGNFLAGCFVARTDLVRAVGGYWEGLPSNHQTELALRLVPECRVRNLPIVATGEILFTVNRSHVGNRRGLAAEKQQPRHGQPLFRATSMILERHEERISRSRTLWFRYVTIAGVAAMRAKEAPRARQLFLKAVRLRPWSWRGWVRLGASVFPPAARRLWQLDQRLPRGLPTQDMRRGQ